MPTAAELSKTAQAKVLDGIKQSQKAVIDSISIWAKAVESMTPATPSLPKLPLAEGVPAPEEIVTEAFAFAEKLLISQKEFTLQVLAAAAPAAPKQAAPKKTTVAA
jgi:hypothetical protein